MPGPVSQSYEPAICRCQHFRELHEEGGEGACTACDCRAFDEIPMDESELGMALNEYIQQFMKEEESDVPERPLA